jgi:hypothetical protein
LGGVGGKDTWYFQGPPSGIIDDVSKLEWTREIIVERQPTKKQGEQSDAASPHVTGGTRVSRLAKHLRGHESGAARASENCNTAVKTYAATEVRQLQFSVCIYKDIGRLYIAVQNAFFMQIAQPTNQLSKIIASL